MSACLSSSVPELDSHLSFIDLCCIFAEETNDRLADLWQQQQAVQPKPLQGIAPRAQLNHLTHAVRTLTASLQQLQAAIDGWKAEEEEEEEEREEAEEDEEDEEVATSVEAEKENDQPITDQHDNGCKPRLESSAATQSKPSILASPAHSKPLLQQSAHHSPTFTTPASDIRRRRASSSANGSSPATPCWDRLGVSDATRQLFVRPCSASAAASLSAGRSSTSSEASLDSLDAASIHRASPMAALQARHQRLSSDSTSSALSAASPLPPATIHATATAAELDTLAAVTETEWSSLPSHLRSSSLSSLNAQLAAAGRQCTSVDGDSGTAVLSVDSLLRADSGVSVQSGKQLLLTLAHLQRVASRGDGQYTVLR